MALSKNVTIRQIASRAKVSAATASRAINQPGNVRSSTRERVFQAIKDLNYPIKQDSSRIILATFTNFVNPFYGQCIQGMQAAAKKRNYQLLLQQIDDPENIQSYDFLMDHPMFRGIIFTHAFPQEEIMDALLAKYTIVMCSQHNDADKIPCVIIDDYTAAKNAVSYLISIGKKKIAMINSQLDRSYAQYREKAYKDTMKAAGLPVYPEWIAHIPEIDFDLAFSAAISLLSCKNRPDAIFCISDVFASTVIKAAGKLGLSIPDDVAVMGFDNVSLCNMTVPSISTVSQPMEQLGWQSCNLLIDHLEGIPVLTSKIVLTTDIVVRSST